MFPAAAGARSGWLAALAACCAVAALGAPHQPPAPLPATPAAPNAATPQPTPTPTKRPGAAGRAVATFDFEEQAFNAEPVPRYWFRAQNDPPSRQRPGFPAWNKAAFDRTVSRSGTASIRLPTRGGSTALRLVGASIPVFPTADYRVIASVQTTDLKHARAFIEATLLDAHAQPIAGASFRSAPIHSVGRWLDVELIVPGRFEQAAFMQLELLLLQPEFVGGVGGAPPLGRHTLWQEDREGAAWFDDVAVLQLPRVSMATRSPANIVLSPQAVDLDVVVRDLTGELLTALLTLRDVDGRTVASETRQIDAGGGAFTWSPPAPRLGWYEATLELRNGERRVGGARCSLVWAAPHQSQDGGTGTPVTRAPDPPFTLISSALHADHYALMPAVLTRTGLGAITLPLVPELPGTAASEAAGPFRACLESLLDMGATPSVAIVALGPQLASAVHAPTWQPWSILRQEDAVWLPSLQRLFDLYGQRVPRWQIGASTGPTVEDEADLPARLARFRQTLQRFIPGPRLALAWSGERPWPAARAGADTAHKKSPFALDALTLSWPQSFATSTIDDACRQFRRPDAAAVDLTIAIETPDSEVYGQRAAVDALMQRAVRFWAGLDPAASPPTRAAATRLALVDPWRVEAGTHPTLNPEATLAAWPTLSRMLSSRRVVGELNAPPGVRCYILAPIAGSAGVGALVAWSESSSEAAPAITGYLGAGPLTLVDAFGNRTPLAPADAAGRYRVPVSSTPAFIENVDTELARFLSGLRVSPGFVPAVAALHEHEIIITNPWPTNISGQVQLLPPESSAARAWRFSPTSPIAFSAGPGQSVRLPFSFSFSASEEAGVRNITALISVAADRSYPTMRVTTPVTIGLADIDLTAGATLSPGSGGPDVMVTVSIANTGPQARTMQLDVQAAGQPSQQQPVSNLGPGESVVRRFVLRGAAAALAGRRIRIALFDVDGTERLNKYVTVP